MTTGTGVSEILAAGAAQGMLAVIDQAPTRSKLRIYADPRPAFGAPTTATLICEIQMQFPVGSVVGSALVLAVPTTPAIALAAAAPTWARWLTGNNEYLADFTARLVTTPDDPDDPAVVVIEAGVIEAGALLRVSFGQLFVVG